MSQVEIILVGGQSDGAVCLEEIFDDTGLCPFAYGPDTKNPYVEIGESVYKLHTDGKAYCVQDTKHFVTPLLQAASTTVKFSKALFVMKAGGCAYRESWNAQDMLCYYVPDNKPPASDSNMSTMVGVCKDDTVPYAGYLVMKTAGGTVIPWIFSQGDVSASDWVVVK
jgi:hypothetical protein